MNAAGELFVDRGYGATTVEAISERADVPAATVYRLFSSKSGILRALLDVAIVGDDREVPMAGRPHVRSLLEDLDPRRKLEGFVALVVDVNSRIGPLYRILTSAAGVDEDAATHLTALTSQRQQGQRMFARSLAATKALRPGLRERDASDIIHALLSPELYRLLVIERGWRTDRYQRWLADTLIDQLLPPHQGAGA